MAKVPVTAKSGIDQLTLEELIQLVETKKEEKRQLALKNIEGTKQKYLALKQEMENLLATIRSVDENFEQEISPVTVASEVKKAIGTGSLTLAEIVAKTAIPEEFVQSFLDKNIPKGTIAKSQDGKFSRIIKAE